MLIVGLVLLAFGGQGLIRLLFDHDRAGWLPGPFGVRLACFAAITAAGLVLAAVGDARAKKRQA